MKTFEEACLATFARTEDRKPGEDDDARSEKMFADIIGDAPRWAAIVDDVQASELATIYLGMVLTMVEMGQMDVKTALQTCFIQGVITGVEMERRLPAVAAESVPGRRERAPGSLPGEPPPTGWTSI